MEGGIPEAEGSSGLAAHTISSLSLLLPVWGEKYTRRFLEFCLPTLLSPRNIPALARELPCRFVLLSSENDEQAITSHPAWRRLAQLCAVEILPIDDLITGNNHTATITLGFERALRQAGQSMRHTCFIFLMSDYLVADGSLASVLAKVQMGARAVLVGNFQIVAEDAGPLLQSRLDPHSGEIVMCPRDLMQLSVPHLHPAAIANIVNFGLVHNAHCNRLFWQVDASTFIGRFYLLHPIAICPQVDDFAIGSSWDYSFVPELCPSGNVVTLTDSDEYLVVEMQRRLYEHETLRAGPFDRLELAQSLSGWTTARHRLNVEQKLIFHAGNRPADLPAVAAQSDAFVNGVRELLTGPPISHRQHPYWIGSLAAHRRDSLRPLDRGDWKLVLNQRPSLGRLRAILQRLEEILLRFPPDVTKLHPLWPDYRLATKSLRSALDAKRRVLLIAQEPALFAQWLSRQNGDAFTISTANLLQIPRMTYRLLLGTFDSVLFILGEESFDCCDVLVKYAAPLLARGEMCNLLFINRRPLETATEFGRSFTRESARLWRPGVSIGEIQYAECSPIRWFIRETFSKLRRRAASGSRTAFYAALASTALLFVCYLANRRASCSRNPPAGIWSSVFVALRISQVAAEDLPSFGGAGDRSAREMLPSSEGGHFPPPDAPDHGPELRTIEDLVREPASGRN